jgi:hypothetical protein
MTGVETYGTIFSVAESYAAAGVIWVGSDDGLVYVTRDAGTNWANVTPRGLPVNATIESIETSRREPGTAYLVAHNYRLDDFKPYLYRTRDFGKSWQALTEGLPADLPLWVVREDPADADYLYLGTDRGPWFSSDAGQHWRELRLNLPAATVTDLEVRHGDLILGTRGRSIWVLEDVAALRAQKTRPAATAILSVENGIRFRSDRRWDYPPPGKLPNAPDGAIISYWLAEAPKGEIDLTITDASGRLVRKLESVIKPPKYGKDDPDEPSDEQKPALTKEPGFNRVVWDLEMEGAKRLASKFEGGDPETGPLAPPGRYTLTLHGAGADAKTDVIVEPDPRSPVPAADVERNVSWSLAVLAALDEVVDNVAEVTAIRQQVSDLRTRIGDASGLDELRATADRVLAACDSIEGTLHNPAAQVSYDILAGRDGGAKLYSQFARLYADNSDSDYPPAQGLRERFDELTAELRRRQAELTTLQGGDLALLEQQISKAQLPRVILPP